MAKKSTKTTTPTTTSAPTPPAPTGTVLTDDLIARLRGADNLDAAVAVLAPTTRTRSDATYTLNATCVAPLPARRGACLKVLAAAVRLDRPFTVADITTALPDVKGARFWVGRLVKSGHFTVTE